MLQLVTKTENLTVTAISKSIFFTQQVADAFALAIITLEELHPEVRANDDLCFELLCTHKNDNGIRQLWELNTFPEDAQYILFLAQKQIFKNMRKAISWEIISCKDIIQDSPEELQIVELDLIKTPISKTERMVIQNIHIGPTGWKKQSKLGIPTQTEDKSEILQNEVHQQQICFNVLKRILDQMKVLEDFNISAIQEINQIRNNIVTVINNNLPMADKQTGEQSRVIQEALRSC